MPSPFLAVAAVLLAATSASTPSLQTVRQQARTDGPKLAADIHAARPTPPYNYEDGTLLDGYTALYEATHDPVYLQAIKQAVDAWVGPEGQIISAKPIHWDAHTLDDLEPGRAILFCYNQTHEERYRKAAAQLYAQFATQPRTPEGGFWHKKVYPEQMWLDGAYMAEPFRAAYARTFHDEAAFPDIARQFILMHDHLRDPRTGLLHHGWDEAKAQPWANKTTGQSPEAWGRGMGWYMLALVDTIPSFPANSPDRAKLIAILNDGAEALSKAQDPATGLWWDVLSQPGRPGNYFESSASAMFVASLARGVRLGYLPARYLPVALRGWEGIETHFVQRNPDGTLTYTKTVKVSGLGGHPYRSGEFDYYIHEPVGNDDPKGMGPFLMAAAEFMQLSGHHSHPMMPSKR